ncbi:hypothetical protein B5F32_11010 [Parabacteroides distasonis]|uniref:DUF4906 domain-containing protein n=1 Tax=Parabacteroides distasonis TaxID=823 RepID=A0A1Y4IIX6_PARDI|nr:DUF4906 domain-containing protein [Parabacteroides distasonis]OUP18940.1 hypothetical protein B5F32_11010 [Parabacteroides distasonis]
MKVLGIKLQKAGLIMMSMMGIIVGMSSCEDRFDTPRPPMPKGKSVDVSLCVGIAGGVDATPTKGTLTDALAAAIPDRLYNLQILQYDSNKSFKKLVPVEDNPAIGSTLNITLAPCDNCHLILVARGATEAIPAFSGSPSWSDLQGKLADYNTINDLTEINNMPYFLHLPNVNVTNEGKVIGSALGEDARILLKRLAVRLTVNWVFGGGSGNAMRDNYTLKEVKLCQVPSAYYLMPQTESDSRFEGDLYPSSLLEYKDLFRLKGDKAVNEGSLTTWMPANAKGKSSQVTSEYYRTKEYAHSAATYMEFVVDSKDGSERLYYRSYLGGKEVSDFNLLENTNYVWTVNIQSADYRTDPRIRLLDQTPVISNNLVPTSNCFMMRPGTNICFNPYKHEASSDSNNTYLSGKTIGSVRVLWQNKDAGTSGDLVMGYAVSNETSNYNHTNLVNYTDLADRDKARVHVKVPVTQGGNAVIAAYAADNTGGGETILWSWHIWVTDYVPAPLSGAITSENRTAAIDIARAATQGGTVHTYQGASWTQSTGAFFDKVIMDRNLGAIRSTYSTSSDLDAARSFGNLYQWGRKDPMPGSVDGSNKEVGIIFNGDGEALPKITATSNGDLEKCIKNPLAFYQYLKLDGASWGPSTKSIYDPCPKGWKVPDFYTPNSVNDMFQGFGYGTSNLMIYFKGNWYSSQLGSQNDNSPRNGFLYMYPGESVSDASANYTDRSVWFPSTRLRELGTALLRSYNPSMTMYSARASSDNSHGWYTEIKAHQLIITNSSLAGKGYGMSVRCVQERR